MPNITQTIPALTAGISQQPDEQKIPGQVKNMVNALPDVTQGLLKRPAGKLVASLSDGAKNSYTTGKWFHYYRDETEQYIGQIIRRKNSDGSSHADDGKVRMWDCLTGAEKNVVDGIGNNTYLIHTDDEDLQTLTLNDFTYINNRSITTEMDTTTEPLGNFGKEIFVELKSISYAKQYALNLFSNTTTTPITTATRLNVDLVKSSNNYCTGGGYMVHHTPNYSYNITNPAAGTGPHGDNNIGRINSTVRCGEVAGDGRDAFAPNVGTEIFSVGTGEPQQDIAAPGGIVNSGGGITDQNYAYNINVLEKPRSAKYNQHTDSSGNNVVTITSIDSTTGATTNGFADINSGETVYVDFLTGETGGMGFDTPVTITKLSNSVIYYYAPYFVSNTISGAPKVDVSRANRTGRQNLYFRIKTTAQSVPYTTGSGTTQTTTYQARYTTTSDLLHGGEGWEKDDFFFVWMKDGYYRVTVKEVSTSNAQADLALVRPSPTPFDTETTITAESILGDIREGITGSTTADTGNGFTVTQIGTGLHITRSTAFNGSTPVGELLNVVSGKVNDVGELPSQCKHGMVVEVVNSVADEDNHFVKFFGRLKQGYTEEPGNPDGLITATDADYLDGEGTWEECAKPGRTIRLKRSKMPVVLIRTSDGNFRLTELDGSSYTITGDPVTYKVPKWNDALVGDDVTNPEPSFIGGAINKMLFFRNRFALLSDEYIVMSRPGDFTNFFNKSAIQQIASDPIDISASSEYPAILYDGIQTNTGLVLFSKNQQFMLTTDSDVFSPLTAKINALSTYNFNYSTNPISLGTTLGFLDNAGKYSRFFEMAQVQREGEPQVIEQSAVVDRLFEKDLKLISNSRENSVVFFSEEGTSTLYGYRYFDQITERKLASWFKWTLTGTIQYHCMQDDFLYVVVRNNGKDQLLKYAIKMDSNTGSIAEHRVHLDHLYFENLPLQATDPNTGVVTYGYNATTNKTFMPKPNGYESTTHQLVAYSTTDYAVGSGRFTTDVVINGSNLEIGGDWRSTGVCIGYLFTMEVELPTIYYLTQSGQNWRADTRANTILHRVKFGFGPVGLYETTLKRTGRVDYTETFELTGADAYQANASSINDDNNVRTVPIYDRNINSSLTIKSTHPAPATIHNMTWEGVYTDNNYTRV